MHKKFFHRCPECGLKGCYKFESMDMLGKMYYFVRCKYCDFMEGVDKERFDELFMKGEEVEV